MPLLWQDFLLISALLLHLIPPPLPLPLLLFFFTFYSQLTFLILQYLSLCCCFFYPLTAQMPLSFFFHLAHLFPFSLFLKFSVSLSLFLSSVSCKLQYHMSRMSSASNKADWLCLVLLTDRQTHVSSQSPMWDHSTSDWHTCLPVKQMQRRKLTYKGTNIITHKYPYTKEHIT